MSESGNPNLQIDTLRSEIGVTDRGVQEELQSIWDALRDPANADLCKAAQDAGLPAELIDHCKEPPFSAERPEGQILIAGAIAVLVGKTALAWATKKALDAAWDGFFWPRLKQHFGADLERTEDAGSR